MRWKKGEGVVGERDTAGMWIGNGIDSEEDIREAMVETDTTLTAAECLSTRLSKWTCE